MDRRTGTALVVGVMLLAGVTYRGVQDRAAWVRVGVDVNGDTVWVDGNNHEGAYWGARVQGRHTPSAAFPTTRVDCAARTASGSFDDLHRAFADTACALTAAAP